MSPTETGIGLGPTTIESRAASMVGTMITAAGPRVVASTAEGSRTMSIMPHTVATGGRRAVTVITAKPSTPRRGITEIR